MGEIFSIPEYELSKYERVYLYGAGYICSTFLKEIDFNIKKHIEAVMVTNSENNKKFVEDIPVLKYSKDLISNKDLIIVMIADYEDVLKKLSMDNVKNIYLYSQWAPLTIGIDFEDIPRWNNEVKEYYKTQEKEKLLFKYIEIETVNRCNGSCSFCPVNRNEKQRKYHKMSRELFEKIVMQLSEINYDGLVALFSNNEPFMDDRIIEFAKYAKEKLPDAFLYLYTNAKLLTLEKFKEIMVYLDYMQIDNYEPEGGKASNVIEIEKYVEESQIKHKYNYFEIDKKAIRASRGGNSPNSRVKYIVNAKCCLPLVQMVVRPDGKISLCCNDALGENTLGDLNIESIEDVWFGEKYAKYRKEIMESRVKISTCKYCNAVDKRKLWGKGEM